MTDYSLWEVILNGDSSILTRVINGVVQLVSPTTTEQRLASKNELKARGTLLMALPDKHQLKFNIHKDAKTLMESIEKRFGGNKETKKVQKTLRKQQYENFTGLSSKSLDQIYDRLQKLINDLFNSLKIYEAEVKSSSSASTSTQNIAFVSSQNADNTNESVSAIASVSAASAKVPVFALPNVDTLSDAVIYSFFANGHVNSKSKEISLEDIKESGANEITSIGFGMSKMECYNCHRRGHFAREYRSPKDTRRNVPVEPQRRNVPVETSTSNALVAQCDGVGSYDWSFQAEEEPTNYALMAFTCSSSSIFDNEVASCSKACTKAYATVDNALVDLRKKFEKADQERDELKLKLEKFQTSSKNLRERYHVVPPPYTGTFMPPKPDLVFHDAPTVNTIVHTAFNIELSPTKPDKDLPHSHRPSAPIIEDWDSNSEDESEAMPTQNAPSFVLPPEHVKTPRPSIKHAEHPIPADNLRKDIPKFKGHSNSKNKKACFVLLTRSKLVPLTAVRPVTTVVPHNNMTRPRPAKLHVIKPHSPPKRTINHRPSLLASNFPPKVTTVKAPKGNPYHALKDKGVIDNGCSRHMTGNMSYLSDFKAINRGYVAFGGNPKGGKIIGKDTECIVLSSDFKLPDDNHVLLKVPRENNMFTWVFFLATKDEISPILKTFITGIKNQLSLKVKIIKSNNRTEFKNHDVNQFCGMKGIKREFSTPRTPQQNGIAERKNRTLIEATRTMLGDSLLPIPFWAEAVNTACYVQNRVLVTKPHNKTPYEPLLGRTPSIGFMRPFGCLVTILNTLDPLGKFKWKANEGFLVGYSVSSKAFRVFNSRTRIIQEILHTNFLENKPNVAGSGPTWLFDIDTLTKSMNYQPVTAGNQHNPSVGIQEQFDAEKVGEENVQQYVLFPLWSSGSKDPHNTDGDATFEVKDPEFEVEKHESKVYVSPSSSAKTKKHDDKTKREAKGKSPVELSTGFRNLSEEFEDFFYNSINEVNTASTPVPVVGQISTNSTNTFNAVGPSNTVVSPTHEKSSYVDPSQYPDDPNMPAVKDITYFDDDEDVGAEADFTNLETTITSSPIPTTRVHKDHPVTQIIGDLSSATQTRSMTKMVKDQGGLTQINNEDFHTCMFACFLSQEEPKREEGIDYEEVFSLVARMEAIRLFLSYASFMGFMVYQMDVKSAFLYGTIEEEVYVYQPPRFEDPDYPDKVYKVVKALYGLHQAPRACYEILANYLLENGFQMGKIDQTLFIKKQKGDILLVQKPDGIFISQDKYVAEILRKFGLTDEKSASTPIDTEKPLLKDLDGDDVDVHTYSNYAGASLDRKYTTGGYQFLGCKLISWQCKKKIVVATLSTEAEYVAVGSCYTQVIWIQNQFFDYSWLVQKQMALGYSKANDNWSQKSIDCLPNEEIFTELAMMGYEKPSTKLTFYKAFFSAQWKFLIHTMLQCMSAKRTAWNEFSSSMASAVICLATGGGIQTGGIIELIDADKDVTLEEVDAAKDTQVKKNADVQGRLEESQAQIYHIDLEHTNKVLSMQDDEPEPVELKNDARRRKGVVIRDLEETATPSTIVHFEPKSKDKGKGIMVEEPKPLKKQAQIEQDEAYAREKPQTEAQARKNMMVYLKNMAGFKMDYFKAKKKKLDKEVEELKKHLQIVPNDDDDVCIEATPLALKVPVVDYEIHTENNKPYYKIIRADGSHQLFLSFLSLLRNFDREDLEMLWQIVQERFTSSKPKNFSGDFLLTTLKAMFEKPDVEAQLWKNQRGVHGLAKVKS
uniref:Integrase catalytic domain-containing protein n=1 Tax=Tanacetum cinerariifolium TaxID=118510 RepID=A0A6L2M5K2_TANCI|nr:hypothetical protein [Tanacetum cinerariifolium]